MTLYVITIMEAKETKFIRNKKITQVPYCHFKYV